MRAEVVLPVPRGPGEQVGLALAAVGDGVAQRPDDVVLALHLAEPAGPVAAVERRGGHRGEPTDGVSAGPAVRRRPRGDVGTQLGRVQAVRRVGPTTVFRWCPPEPVFPAACCGSLVGRAARRRRASLLLGGPVGAQAPTLVETTPADGAELDDVADRRSSLTFDEPIGDADHRHDGLRRRPVRRRRTPPTRRAPTA